jgi:catechol 2,3-dioxygenase-like lactoylglutathione lyase family enzyme
VMTNDTDAFHAFYREVFDATISQDFEPEPGMRLSMVDIGEGRELNVFQVDSSTTASSDDPMFHRGRLDHIGLQASSLEAFEEIRSRLMARRASDEFVTDFGPVLSVFFVGPDGTEGEVCVINPDAQPGVVNPPGTPAARYVPTG